MTMLDPPAWKQCPECKGRGGDPVEGTVCPHCNGEGWVPGIAKDEPEEE